MKLSVLGPVAVAFLVLLIPGCGGNIQQAVYGGRVNRVKKLLDRKPISIHSTNGYGETLLHIAANQGDVPMVALLIRRGAEIDARDRYGRTPLFSAVGGTFGPHPEVAKMLVDHGADVNARKNSGETVLCYALEMGRARGPKNIEAIEVLLKAGADVNAPENSMGWTPLHIAAANGYGEAAKLLIKYGADCEKKNASGQTPAQVATDGGFKDIAAMITAAAAKQEMKKGDKGSEIERATE